MICGAEIENSKTKENCYLLSLIITIEDYSRLFDKKRRQFNSFL